MADEILLTQDGYDRLKAELENLKGPVRMELAEAIREAKSHGDLRENAAYHEAKLNQSRVEGRLADLEKMMERAKIVERGNHGGNIADLGSKVTLLDFHFEEELVITLVGSFEADPSRDLISITSPLGEGVFGKSVEEEFEVEAPAGTQKYKVIRID